MTSTEKTKGHLTKAEVYRHSYSSSQLARQFWFLLMQVRKKYNFLPGGGFSHQDRG
ncbi:hypothetical protein ACV2I9_23945 [Salmonella enterica subsp. enterica serovar Sandiego]